MKACGICHSDIHYMDGVWGGDLPVVLGHEGAGLVEAVGPGVTGCQPGDRVAVGLMRHCDSCFHCEREEHFLCAGEFPLDRESRLHMEGGAAVGQGLRTGAFAEQVVVEQSQVIPLPEGVPFEAAALLTCGVLTGWGAVVRTAQVPAGSSVGVIGVGGVGINSVQAAAMAGADTVMALDFEDEKLSLARNFGATHGVNARSADVESAVMEATAGHGLDYVFVTVGSSKAVEQGLRLVRRGGAVVLVGMPADDDLLTHQAGDLAGNHQRILGSKMGGASARRDLPMLATEYLKGGLKLDELVSGRFSLDEINSAIEEVKRGGALRNVIVF
jgi:S-(hydroxymethyl)glutathione dehydrogenase / alcohol dehydrogenase